MKFCVQIWRFYVLSIKIILVNLPLTPLHLVNIGFVHFWTFDAFPFSELGPTLHLGGKTPIIPKNFCFRLYYIEKVGLVIWKLSLEDFNKYLRQQSAAGGII